ncbi:hypothetical protein NDU88_005095 [Pleurodeles waltl]|uniref:UPAR/Ly6 domain-containing protein n=1 Tax=Pleurodeles waltl TaxID=8319 RepID=A0AAV7V702_PLEWA|nr:hypothetical protein NDU88_005095 [Pleurodeles waltl]
MHRCLRDGIKSHRTHPLHRHIKQCEPHEPQAKTSRGRHAHPSVTHRHHAQTSRTDITSTPHAPTSRTDSEDMRCALGSLLAAALLVGLAHALKCHNCVSTQGDCNTPNDCPADQNNYCFKFVGTNQLAGITTIVKGCNATCQAASATLQGISGSVSCCTTNLCNGEGASAVTTAKPNGVPSVRVSYTVLYATVGVTALLLRRHI